MSQQDLIEFLRENLKLEVLPGKPDCYRPKLGGLVLKLAGEVLSEVPISIDVHEEILKDEIRIRLNVGDQVISAPSIARK